MTMNMHPRNDDAKQRSPVIGIDARGLEGNCTGVGRYLSNLLRIWAREDRGVQFRLYFKDAVPDDIPQASWIEPVLLSSGSNALWTHWHLPRALHRDRVDVLFSPWYIAPLFGMGRIPFTVSLHDIVFEAHPEWVPPADRVLLRWIARRSAKRAAAIITISDFSKREIMQHYDIPEEKIVVTPLGVDPVFRSADPVPLDDREELFVFVGSLFHRRNVPEMIEGFVKLHPRANLLLVGEDHTYPSQDVDAYIHRSNAVLGRRAIARVTHLSDASLFAVMRSAAAVVSLSTYEGFNLPPVEAQALGTPVLVADTAVAREVLGKGAFYIERPSHIGEIADAMRVVLRRGPVVQEKVARGQDNVRRYSWERCADVTLDVLRDRYQPRVSSTERR